MSGVKYLPGLNGMRALGVLMIMMFHFSQHMTAFGFARQEVFAYAHQMVTMFFVLSGFLITRLLLTELQGEGQIHIGNFYMRRLLRVWPAYFMAILILVAGYIIADKTLPLRSLFFYTFFLGNIPIVLGTGIGPVAQLWSLGVEEQFYLVWPWLFRNKKWLATGIWSIILLYFVLKGWMAWAGNEKAYSFLTLSRYHCMAWGGVLALALHRKERWINWLYNPIVQVLAWGWCIWNTIQPVKLPAFVISEFNAIVFGVILLNVATNAQALINLESRFLKWLGNISYGIYLYHMFAFSLVLHFMQNRLEATPSAYLLIVFLAATLAILGAWASFHLVEKYFLSLKSRFASSDKPVRVIPEGKYA